MHERVAKAVKHKVKKLIQEILRMIGRKQGVPEKKAVRLTHHKIILNKKTSHLAKFAIGYG